MTPGCARTNHWHCAFRRRCCPASGITCSTSTIRISGNPSVGRNLIPSNWTRVWLMARARLTQRADLALPFAGAQTPEQPPLRRTKQVRAKIPDPGRAGPSDRAELERGSNASPIQRPSEHECGPLAWFHFGVISRVRQILAIG